MKLRLIVLLSLLIATTASAQIKGRDICDKDKKYLLYLSNEITKAKLEIVDFELNISKVQDMMEEEKNEGREVDHHKELYIQRVRSQQIAFRLDSIAHLENMFNQKVEKMKKVCEGTF